MINYGVLEENIETIYNGVNIEEVRKKGNEMIPEEYEYIFKGNILEGRTDEN